MSTRRPRVLDSLLRGLDAAPRDAALLGWAGGTAFALHAGAVLAWSVLMGRYVARLGGEAMPAVYISVNLFSLGIMLSMARGKRQGKSGRPGALAGLSALLLVALGLAPMSWSRPQLFVAFLLSWMYMTLFEIHFWQWLGGITGLRAGRRITAGVGALGTLGRVAGAALATDPLGLGSVERLLVLAAGLTILVPFLLARAEAVAAAHPEAPGTSGAEANPGAEDPPRDTPTTIGGWLARIAATPLLVRVAVLAAAAGFFKGAADYPLAITAKQAFPNEAEMGAFLGWLGAGVNLTAVVLQLLGTGRMLRRLPLAVAVGLFPAGVLLGGLAAAGWGGFHLAVALRFFQRVTTRAVFVPACVILLAPYPKKESGPARALAYGAAGALGFLVAGAGIPLAGGAPPLAGVYLALALVAVVALVAASGLDRAYLDALGDVSGTQGTRHAMALRDPLADQLLSSGDAALVEVALAQEGAEARLVGGVADLDPGSQVLALEALRNAEALPEFSRGLAVRLLSDPRREVRDGAARVVGAGGRSGDTPLALEALEAHRRAGRGSSALRLAGLVLQLTYRGRDVWGALRVLRSGLRSSRPERRAAAVRELGRAGHAVFFPDLEAALEDPAPEVVRTAARALARVGRVAAIPVLQARAQRAEPALRGELERALAALGSGALRSVGGLMDRLDAQERRRLAGVLRGLGGEGPLEMLPRVLRVTEPEARHALARFLQAGPSEAALAAVATFLDGAEGEDLEGASWRSLFACWEENRIEPSDPLAELLRALGPGRPVAKTRRFLRGFVARHLADDPETRIWRARSLCFFLELTPPREGEFLEALQLARQGGSRGPAARELIEAATRDGVLREATGELLDAIEEDDSKVASAA